MKEPALFKGGTTGFIIPENQRLLKHWTCDYQGRTFEWHANMWMEI